MKIGLQFAMPVELHALPGARELEPFEIVSGVPFFQIEPSLIACAGGISKVNAAMAAEILCLKYGADLILNAGVAGCCTDLPLADTGGGLRTWSSTTWTPPPWGTPSDWSPLSTRWPSPPGSRSGVWSCSGSRALTPSPGRVATGDWFAVPGPSGRLGGPDLPAPSGGDGGLRHRPGVPAQPGGLCGPQVRLRPPVLGKTGGGVLRLQPGPGKPGTGAAAAGPGPGEGIPLSPWA